MNESEQNGSISLKRQGSPCYCPGNAYEISPVFIPGKPGYHTSGYFTQTDFRSISSIIWRLARLKEKLSFSGEMKIRQELWQESPCSKCERTPCCRNLPLDALYLESQRDFINLALTSCYEGIFPALKSTGEWTFYMERDCGFLDRGTGKCSIHSEAHQSIICKSYDAHNCWYTKAFSPAGYSSMIPFTTDMLIWYEKKYNLIENRFYIDISWDELCESAFDYAGASAVPHSSAYPPLPGNTLSYRKSRTEQFIFFPPYKRPESIRHFELLSFRLGFPGIYLAVTDSIWAFAVTTSLNRQKLNLLKEEYYPAIEHKDGSYSFNSLKKEFNPFSATGEQWVILNRGDIEVLKALTVIDPDGRIKRLPSTPELLSALRSKRPDRAA